MKTALPDYQIANNEAKALFDTLGLEVNISQPRGDVRDNWPNILFECTFTKGRAVVRQDYRLGVGHVKPGSGTIEGLTDNELSCLRTWQKNSMANFTDKNLQARVAAKLAKAQGVKPKAHEVFSCICSEATEAHGMSFNDWCDTFGADNDSIKARATYDHCAQLYFPLVQLAGEANVKKLAELNAQF